MTTGSVRTGLPNWQRLLRGQELDLRSELPVGTSGGSCDVVVGRELHVDGLAADLEHPPEAISDRHGRAGAPSSDTLAEASKITRVHASLVTERNGAGFGMAAE